MSELHWTSAAVLLALAVLGGGSARQRHPIATWADFAREHGLAVDEPPSQIGRHAVRAGAASGLAPSQAEPVPRGRAPRAYYEEVGAAR